MLQEYQKTHEIANCTLDGTRIGSVEVRPRDTEAFTSDILPTFEDYSYMHERELGEQTWRAQVEKNRKERKMREGDERGFRGMPGL